MFVCLLCGLFLAASAQLLATAHSWEAAITAALASRYCTGSGRLKSHVVVSCIAVRLSHGLKSLATVGQQWFSSPVAAAEHLLALV